MKKTITGKIIRILDRKTVIVNLGSEHGITEHSIFSIMGEPEQIVDPETGENLGEVTVVKSRVKASEVAEKFTIATTKWKTARLSFLDSFLSNINKNVETFEMDEGELNVDPAEINPWKAKSEAPVRVGDIVQVEVDIEEKEGSSTEERINTESQQLEKKKG